MSRRKTDYEEIAVVRDEETGLVAPITRLKRANGYHLFSFSIMKEFERKPGSLVERSVWLNERHAPAIHRLVDEAIATIEKERDRMLASQRRKRVEVKAS